MPDQGVFLGVDFGTRKIGIAVGHALTGSGRPLEAIFYSEPEGLDRALVRLLGQWRPARIIVGLPLDLDGKETETSKKVRAFCKRLGELAPDAAIELHDERLTSVAAASGFADRRGQGRARKRDVAKLDSMAAALILESWMSEHACQE